MIKNYLKVALRNIWKDKLVSSTNLFGLTLGISCCLLLLLFVRYEYSFDEFSDETENIYFHYYEQKGANSRKVGLSGNEGYDDLASNYSGISDIVKIRNNGFPLIPDGQVEKKLYIESWYGTSNFFEFFGYPLVQGDPSAVLSDPSSIVLTASTAKRLFGTEDPMGKTVTIDVAYLKKDLVVTGIAEDIKNSHIQFEAIVPWNIIRPSDGAKIADMYYGRSLFTYVKTPPGVNIEQLEEEVNKPLIENGQNENVELFFMPFRDVYLEGGGIQFMAFISGNKQTTNTLFFIALIILLVACINYVNLQTARGTGRSKEVGVRKVLGARKGQLKGQFMAETFMFTLVASLLSILAIDLSLPYFNQLTGKAFTIQFLFSEGLLTLLILIATLTALISGLYPAFILSSFQPVKALKSATRDGMSGAKMRKGLMMAQFGVSMFLMAVTYLSFQQNQYINKKDLGFNKEQVITFGVTTKNMDARKLAFKSEIANYPGIEAVSISTDILGDGYTNNSGFISLLEDPETKAMTTIFGVDHDFVDAYDMEIVAGRTFDITFFSDSSGVVVNQELVKQLSLEEPIGQKIGIRGSEYTILGVVKDFNFQELHQKINPAMLRISRRNLWSLSVRLKPETISESIEYIESKWAEFEPEASFQYDFIDQRFAVFYETEVKLMRATTFFSLVSIFLTSLGLFGMTTFVIERKLKEIGIRKVLGASIRQINLLIFREFGVVLIIAFIIATPLAYYASTNWLSEFAYRIDISVLPFAIALLLSTMIVSITVGGQSVRAAKKDLSNVLRNE